MATKPKGSISELRQDLVSGDWVVIATGRAKRPHAFAGKPATLKQSRAQCPADFERPFDKKHPPLLRYDYDATQDKRTGWAVVVKQNRYPAFAKGVCKFFSKEGPYTLTAGVGFHELFILRDHGKFIPDLTGREMAMLVRAYRDRYTFVADQECIEYVSVFHNHGREAGSSVSHLHSQLIGLPVIPPDVFKSIRGSERYFDMHQKCVHCVMVAHEARAKKRVIYENKEFIVFVPFVSRIAFEVRIFPKIHSSNFRTLTDENIPLLADALQTVIRTLHRGLNDPAFNFFIHTSPAQDHHHHYHWHMEIIPKTSVWAGFELGTGIEISALLPEDAAEYLRNVEIKS